MKRGIYFKMNPIKIEAEMVRHLIRSSKSYGEFIDNFEKEIEKKHNLKKVNNERFERLD